MIDRIWLYYLGVDGEFSGSLQQMAQTVANAMSSNAPADGEGNEFQSAIAQALKDISATSETLQVNTVLPHQFHQ